MIDLERIVVSPEVSIREVALCIDGNGKGIALVLNHDRHLIGTVTDGDIRRAVLAGVDLSTEVTELFKRKTGSLYSQPLTAQTGTDSAQLLRLMRRHSVRHIPLLDDVKRVVGLVTLDDLISTSALSVTAVIMAGGHGKRLRPLTDETPKPMLPVGGRPLMEWIVDGLSQAGIGHIIITTHYKAEQISRHFGVGDKFGVQIEYIHEDKLSGSAGALGLLDDWDEPLLVVNGDILTRVDFRAMFNYHQEQKADMSIAIREYNVQVPYGIVETDGTRIRQLTEKPSLRFFVNAGIYYLEPVVQGYITKGEFLDMTDLMGRLIADGRSLTGFPLREYWIDIGQVADYERAQQDMQNEGPIE